MTTNIEKSPGSLINLEVILSEQEFKSYWEDAHSRAVVNLEIKGFRKGAAPEELARQAIDKEKVFEHAAHEAVRSSLNTIIQEHNWTVIDQPKIEVIEASPLVSAGSAKKLGLKYKADLVVFPEVELGNYKKIAHKVLAQKSAVQIEPQEVDKTLELVRGSRSKITLANRRAAVGDLIEADISSSAQGKPIEGGHLNNDRFVLGESHFMPGFDEQLMNHSAGETVEFYLTAPEDYWHKDLGGKKIDFQVKLKSVFDRKLPELNDEFAKSLGPNFSSIADVRESVSKGLAFEKEEKEKDRIRAKMLQEIVKASRIDPPEIMVDKTLDTLIKEVKAMVKHSEADPYTDAELKKELGNKARERLLANLVIHKIVETEHLEPTAEEIKDEARLRNLDPEKNYDYNYGIVQHRKVFEFLERQ